MNHQQQTMVTFPEVDPVHLPKRTLFEIHGLTDQGSTEVIQRAFGRALSGKIMMLDGHRRRWPYPLQASIVPGLSKHRAQAFMTLRERIHTALEGISIKVAPELPFPTQVIRTGATVQFVEKPEPLLGERLRALCIVRKASNGGGLGALCPLPRYPMGKVAQARMLEQDRRLDRQPQVPLHS